MTAWLLGKSLYLHSIHCVEGCQECNGRTLTQVELQDLRDRGELGPHGPIPRVARGVEQDPED